jgi:hypothetical protein
MITRDDFHSLVLLVSLNCLPACVDTLVILAGLKKPHLD